MTQERKTPFLWYRCAPRPFRVPLDGACHREQVGVLTVSEYHRSNAALPYGIRMRARVGTHAQLSSAKASAFALAAELDRVWPYVAGVPLFPTRLVMQVLNAPSGWYTNYKQVKSRLPTPSFQMKVGKPSGGFWITTTSMPLKPALAAVKALKATSEETRVLMDYHARALLNLRSEPGLLMFAKGLELARALLPGKSDSQKSRSLPEECRTELRHPLSWLFKMSNERIDLRHVVKKKTPILLHRKLSPDEAKDFEHDADLVLRGTVTTALGIEIVVLRGLGK